MTSSVCALFVGREERDVTHQHVARLREFELELERHVLFYDGLFIHLFNRRY